jgi:hypothetical protein
MRRAGMRPSANLASPWPNFADGWRRHLWDQWSVWRLLVIVLALTVGPICLIA